MRRLFWEDPYLAESDAVVTNVQDGYVEMDPTIIYAFSGGQQSDVAWINGQMVTSAEVLEGGRIRYGLNDVTDFLQGQNIYVKIDWDVRFKVMKLHSATHMAMATLFDIIGELPVIGANVTSEKGRIDFSIAEPLTPHINRIASEIDTLVVQDLPITVRSEDQKDFGDKFRVWQIVGKSRHWVIPCGGTHPKRTSEIGKLAIKRVNIGAGKERIELALR